MQIEHLGKETIDGVEVRGQRITRTIHTGAIGNDEPLVSVTEYWRAPSLGHLILRMVSNDPKTGKHTMDLVSLDLREPGPAIFRPPANYRIVTQQMHQVPCSEIPH